MPHRSYTNLTHKKRLTVKPINVLKIIQLKRQLELFKKENHAYTPQERKLILKSMLSKLRKEATDARGLPALTILFLLA